METDYAKLWFEVGKKKFVRDNNNLLNFNLDHIKDWLKLVIQRVPKDFAVVEVFAVLTGLRPSEACMSTNLISELSIRDEFGLLLESGFIDVTAFPI